MTRDEFIETLKTERQMWENRLEGIDFHKPLEPTVSGKINLRDIIYHVAWYEREMVEVLQLRALVGSPWWELHVDERNAYIFDEGQSISLAEAYHYEQQIYAELLSQLQLLSDEELGNARFFREMPPDWKPWEVLASNTFEHYPQHIQDIPARSTR